MKGNNTLELNEATMIVAVQEYLNKRITVETPIVKSVKRSGKAYENGFTVELAEGEGK